MFCTVPIYAVEAVSTICVFEEAYLLYFYEILAVTYAVEESTSMSAVGNENVSCM